MKKMFALMLTLVLLTAAVPTLAANVEFVDLIRYVPLEIDLDDDLIVVTGCFVNMSNEAKVVGFRDLRVTFYENGNELFWGDFGDIKVTVEERGTTEYALKIKTAGGLKDQTLQADCSYFADWSGKVEYSR